MLRLKSLNRGLASFLITGLLISSPGNAAQTGTGDVRGSHDSSGQNAGGGSFLPNNVTNDVPLPHYCTTTGTNNSQGTWLDNGGACCGTTSAAQPGGCASCSGADSITNGTWVISGSSTGWSTVNNTSVTAGAVCCGTGANATNAACLPYCSVGLDGPHGTGINTQTGGSCCGSQSFLVPAPGGSAVSGPCANDVNCQGSVPTQGQSGTWASGPNVGQTCCGSGTILSGGANNGACTPVCSGTASTSGTWSNGAGACCGSGTTAVNGACIPTCNGTPTTNGTWSDGTGPCCGLGPLGAGATNGVCFTPPPVCNSGFWSDGSGPCCGSGASATSGACPASPTCSGGMWSNGSGPCCGSGTTATSGACPPPTLCPSDLLGALSNQCRIGTRSQANSDIPGAVWSSWALVNQHGLGVGTVQWNDGQTHTFRYIQGNGSAQNGCPGGGLGNPNPCGCSFTVCDGVNYMGGVVP